VQKSAPSNLEDHLGYWLRCLSNFVSASFAERLAQHDVSVAQWVVLRTLYDSGAVTLNRAAELIGVDKSSLSRMAERLVKKSWLHRVAGRDRRSVALSLTPAGRALVPKLARLADENDHSFFQPLSAHQRQEFLATIQLLLRAHDWTPTTRGQDRME
jgi:DNA-binding MarR family transcriptional regulator